MSDKGRDVLPDLIALWVHDLRNPIATVSANLTFLREGIDAAGPDVLEALADVNVAVGDLARGLDQLAWIGRWLAGQRALDAGPGDARRAVDSALGRIDHHIVCELPPSPLDVRAAGTALARLVEVLVRNALAFAPPGSIEVRAFVEAPCAIIEVRDAGRALGEDLRESAFTLAGQHALKERGDGRYSRVTGLLAARALADALGAELTAAGSDGAAVFRVRLPLA